jgi:hypothetical protein
LNYGIANYENQIFDQKAIEDIIQHAIVFSIDFELQVPPLEQSEIITLAEKQYNTTTSGMSTGKRLGFEFKSSETKPLI